MTFQFSPWLPVLLLGAAISAALAVASWRRRRSPGGLWFVCFLAAAGWWQLFEGLQLLVVPLGLKILAAQLMFFGVTSVVLFLFLFCFEYRDLQLSLPPAARMVLWIVPAAVTFLAFTNSSHRLVWAAYERVSGTPLVIYDFPPGPVLWFFIGYSWALLLGATFILSGLLRRSENLVKSQAIWIILGIAAPWAGNLVYLLGLGPSAVDSAPVGFVLSGIFFSRSLFHYRLLNITPVAYGSIFDYMTDAVIVFDMDRKIVEANPAAGILFPVSKADYGRPLTNVLDPWPEYRDRVAAVIPLAGPRSMLSRRGEEWLETRLFSIFDRSGEIKGGYLIARDITESKKAEEERTATQERIQRQQKALLQLSLSKAAAEGDFPFAIREISEAAARTLGIERASLWLGSADIGHIRCIDLYLKSQDLHSPGPVLDSGQFPRYFEALGRDRFIDASDARADPRTREFTDGYLSPLGIGAMLDSPIRVAGAVVGIVCCEHVGESRRWLDDEIRFVCEIADMAAHAFASWEKQKMETAQRESEERFRMLVEGAPDGIFVQSLGNFAFLNPAAVRLFGAHADEDLVGRPVLDMIHPEYRERAQERLELLDEAQKNIPRMEEVFLRVDGTSFPAETASVPIRYRGLDGMMVFVRDITRRKEAEDALRASLAEKVVLIREIQNRVRNNMQIVSSLLNHQAGAFSDPVLRGAFRASRDRIKAISLVHERLYRSGDLARIDFGDYIQNLVIHLFHLYQVDPGRIRHSFRMDPSRFDVNVAIPLGLIINELVLNSLQHAFPGGRSGEIFIRLSKNGERFHTLEIRDDGVGIREKIDLGNAKTLGFQLVGTLIEQIGGVVNIGTMPGVSFTITFPDRPVDDVID